MPPFLTSAVLRFPTMGERDFLKFQRKGEAKYFPKNILHYRKFVSRIICDTVYKYPL